MSRGVLVLVLVLLVTAGCDRLFGLLDVDAPPVDARGDGPPDDSDVVDPTSDGAPPDVALLGCPPSYSTFGGNGTSYRLGAAVDWLTAQNACLADQAITGAGKYTHLVVLGDDIERGFVGASVIGNGNQAWSGLSDRATFDTFRWVTNENTKGYPPVSGPWASGEPSGNVGEDCVRMNTTANLADTLCTTPFPFVCECDDHPNAPSNY